MRDLQRYVGVPVVLSSQDAQVADKQQACPSPVTCDAFDLAVH